MESPMGPGFESQVPNIFAIIFLQMIQRLSCLVVYHTPQISRRQMASRPNPKAKIECPSWSQVNAYAWNLESQVRLEREWATNCQSYLQIGPNTPLGLFFFLFFLYLFICFIIYFYYH